MAENIPGFLQYDFHAEGTTKPVYQLGSEGQPPVVLMHELPGMVPECVALARELHEEGFAVTMPLMFGQPNQHAIVTNTLRICLSREFSMFAKGKSSPLASWMRALCRKAHEESGGRPIGVIGMCLTGNFALTLMVDEFVMAPVMSQPSLPVGFSQDKHEDLGTDPAILEQAVRRSQEENLPLLGLRFTCDPLCRGSRFQKLEELFGERFRKIEIDSSAGNPHGIPRASHAVLTVHRVKEPNHPTQQAFREVVAFLHEQLQTNS
ncbi:MAG: dienelactone hydrolase [Deltaproteobacteria bacterium]|nr:MAG: dienelactone hydrolase [Deltaproteobacteria bacterium]